MKLYSYYRSSAAYRVRIALHLKQIDFHIHPVNLSQNEQNNAVYLSRHPQGLVPALELDDGRLLTQSMAILEWLETQNAPPALLPDTPYEAAKARQIAHIIVCDIHPLNNQRVLNWLGDQYAINAAQKKNWYHHWIHQGFSALEKMVTATPYCLGSQISLADVCLIPQIYNAMRFDVDMTRYAKLMRINQSCHALPAFLAAHPDHQADSPCPASPS